MVADGYNRRLYRHRRAQQLAARGELYKEGGADRPRGRSDYIQAYTSCNIEYAIPTDQVMADAKAVEDDRYKFAEYVSDEAKGISDGAVRTKSSSRTGRGDRNA